MLSSHLCWRRTCTSVQRCCAAQTADAAAVMRLAAPYVLALTAVACCSLSSAQSLPVVVPLPSAALWHYSCSACGKCFWRSLLVLGARPSTPGVAVPVTARELPVSQPKSHACPCCDRAAAIASACQESAGTCLAASVICCPAALPSLCRPTRAWNAPTAPLSLPGCLTFCLDH